MYKKVHQMLNLLQAGKKVRWDDTLILAMIPQIELRGETKDGHLVRDKLNLDCVSDLESDVYVVEQPLYKLDEVAVVGYESPEIKIKYVYAKAPSGETYAVVEDGAEVKYRIELNDVNRCFKGEYREPIEATVSFFNGALIHPEYAIDELKVIIPGDGGNMVDWIVGHCRARHVKADLFVNFKNGNHPLFIPGTRRF